MKWFEPQNTQLLCKGKYGSPGVDSVLIKIYDKFPCLVESKTVKQEACHTYSDTFPYDVCEYFLPSCYYCCHLLNWACSKQPLLLILFHLFFPSWDNIQIVCVLSSSNTKKYHYSHWGGATTVKVFCAIIYRSTKIEQNFSAEDEPLDKFESAKIGILGKLHEIELEQIGQCSVWPDWAIYRLLGEFLKSAVTRRYRKVDP